jgi:hypothetical protein
MHDILTWLFPGNVEFITQRGGGSELLVFTEWRKEYKCLRVYVPERDCYCDFINLNQNNLFYIVVVSV